MSCKDFHITTVYGKLDLPAPNRRGSHFAKES